MAGKKKQHPREKAKLHIRNKHRQRYDFKELLLALPELSEYVILNKYNDETIDFANPDAVKALNKALLKHYYEIENWDIPDNYLCPPIPGRADYIHHVSDLVGSSNFGKIPTDKDFVCLDIGVGANCVYPIIGVKEYGWSFIGSELDSFSIENAQKIIETNPTLKENVELRKQSTAKDIFYGILDKEELVDISICNPPFHASKKEAQKGTLRKLNNLNQEKVDKPTLNFGGQNNELWCEGGEERFIRGMIRESKKFTNNCYWFTTLVAKQTHLKSIYKALEDAKAVVVKTIPMGQGNKTSRVVAWTFLNKDQQTEWRKSRWKVSKPSIDKE